MGFLERYSSFLAAEAFNCICEYNSGKVLPRIDLWNGIGRKSELDFKTYQKKNPSMLYNEYQDELIESRYELIQRIFGVSRAARTIVKDLSLEYMFVVQSKVRELIENHVVEVLERDFHYCETCDYHIALTDAALIKCPACENKNLVPRAKKGLFMHMSKQTGQSTFSHKTGADTYKRVQLSMRPLIQIAKQREYGVSLEEYGVDSIFKLDPKIGLACLGVYTQQIGLGELTDLFTGIDALKNIAPYMERMQPTQKIHFVTTGLMPSLREEQVTDSNRGFFSVFFPLLLTALQDKVTEANRTALFKEFFRTRLRAQTILQEPNCSGVDASYLDEHTRAIFDLTLKYEIRAAMLHTRELVNTLFKNKGSLLPNSTYLLSKNLLEFISFLYSI